MSQETGRSRDGGGAASSGNGAVAALPEPGPVMQEIVARAQVVEIRPPIAQIEEKDFHEDILPEDFKRSPAFRA